ncbi:MAG TPA: hypothetical protein VKR27_03435 [Acidimicrobiales bacterium]|nr:hypothetical protein [Acidimicrobiales bacterium]
MAVALRFFGVYLVGLGRSYGWVAYAPLSSSAIGPPGTLHPWAQTLIWIALVVFWVVASVYLLRPVTSTERVDRDDSQR